MPPEFVDKNKYLCSECPAIFFSKESLNAHVHKHRENSLQTYKQFECKKCQLTISGKKNYASHCEKVHNEVVPGAEKIECTSCDEIFSASSYYIKHYQSVHGSLPPEYENKELFEESGGLKLDYVESLNFSDAWVQAIIEIVNSK